MRYLQIIRIAYRALNRNKMRSSLTMLGIIIGVGAVIAMVGIGQGAKKMVDAQIASLGDNLLTIFPGSHTAGGVHGGAGTVTRLTEDDAKAITQFCPAITKISPVVRTNAQVVAGNLNWGTSVEGYSPDFVSIRSWPVASGTFFTDQDVRGATKVCVLGKTIVDNLFPDQDPVGQIIRIKKLPFRVIGVMSSKGQNAFGRDQDDLVLVPYTTAQKKLMGVTYVNSIIASANDRTEIDLASDQITQLLRQRHRIQTGEADDFTVRSQLDIASVAGSTSQVMTILLGAIASVSLIVGGIGIMNIMLATVSQRTREIGVRRCVGASRWDIVRQFMLEALVITCFGGLIGIAMGVGGARVISNYAGWRTIVSGQAVVISFGVSALVGVIFGLYPAVRAAMVDPIEALRYS